MNYIFTTIIIIMTHMDDAFKIGWEIMIISMPVLNLAIAVSITCGTLMSDLPRYTLVSIHACAGLFACMLSTTYPNGLCAVTYWHICVLSLSAIIYISALIRRCMDKPKPEPMKTPLLSSGPEEP